MAVKMTNEIGRDGIKLAYECFGDANLLPVLLIMGVGGQMVGWPEGFITELLNKGLYVVRFDNRDVGLSTHLHNAPQPDLPAVLSGDLSSVAYTLTDMATDTIGLLDALKLDDAHIIGASMGGFIAQTLAIEFPERVRSLTSIMSTTGAFSVGQPSPDAMNLFNLPQPTNRDEAMDNAVSAAKVIGSPAYTIDEADVRKRAGLAYDRCYDPIGVARQAVASVASGDRTSKLQSLKLASLVIHGDADKMCDISGGEATARAIPGAEYVVIEGMGHDLPSELWPRLTKLIADHVLAAEKPR